MSAPSQPPRNRARSVDNKSGLLPNGATRPVPKPVEPPAKDTRQEEGKKQNEAGSAGPKKDGLPDGEVKKDNAESSSKPKGPTPDSEAAKQEQNGYQKEEPKQDQKQDQKPGASQAPDAVPGRLRLVEIQDGESPTQKTLCRPRMPEPTITLAKVRQHLAPWISRSHRFCYADGSREDEATTLSEYLTVAGSLNKGGEGTAAEDNATIYVSRPASTKPATNIPTLERPDLGQRLGQGDAAADKFQSRDRAFADIDKVTGGMTADAKHATALTADEWDIVLQNCCAMYGWYVDQEHNTIARAPKPAFQLRRDRSKLVSAAPAADPVSPPPPATNEAERSTQKTLPSTSVTPTGPPIALKPGATNESTAPVPVGAQEKLLIDQLQSIAKDVVVSTPPPPPPPRRSFPATFELPGSLANDALPLIKPHYHVNDNSKVEVFIITNEMQESMAKNDFSAQSTEASVSGGFGGFGGSVSGGYASSKSSSVKTSTSSFDKTMVAKYMYPRATVSLEPSDLEPTPELWEALVRLKRTKSVVDMRRLHREFGHLFCKQITIGGRLLSTKIVSSTETKKEQLEKQEFKASVAVAVTTPWVSASAKHERSGGSSTENNSGSSQTSEKHAFEAVGGDTVLSSDPPSWATSCTLHLNWRVIERVALTPLSDAISDLPKMAGVKTLFAQALPTLSRSIELTDGAEVQVRLRLAPQPNRTLSVPFPAEYLPPSYYLGHEEDAYVAPQALMIRSPNNFWVDIVERPKAGPLFSPQSYRAPAIYGYSTHSPESVIAGAQTAVRTTWDLSAPFDTVITNQCRVVLRMKPIPKDGQILPRPLSLAVFRNQQGVFLPCMSDDENPQVFRIVKDGMPAGSTITEDDVVRFSWDVKDQVVGYRDFSDDAFGRRRIASSDPMPLYFKLPWPRFEKIQIASAREKPFPNNLVMSAVSSMEDTKSTIRTLPDTIAGAPGGQGTYMLQDVQFRLNLVSGRGNSELENYMLASKKVEAKPEKTLEIQQQYRYVVFGPACWFLFAVPRT